MVEPEHFADVVAGFLDGRQVPVSFNPGFPCIVGRQRERDVAVKAVQ
jgi:hypothetical protein